LKGRRGIKTETSQTLEQARARESLLTGVASLSGSLCGLDCFSSCARCKYVIIEFGVKIQKIQFVFLLSRRRSDGARSSALYMELFPPRQTT